MGNKHIEATVSGQQKKQISMVFIGHTKLMSSSWRSKFLSLNTSSLLNQNLLNIEKLYTAYIGLQLYQKKNP
jgi:hypothetical protein